MSNQWKAKKTLAMYEEDMKRSGLKRELGRWSLTTLGIGCIIGAGIFVMTGLAAKEYAGPALALSFVVAGLGCTFAALCYAEFASIIPVEGSAYAYAYATVGELFAWIIGWDLIIEYSMASSTVAVGWSAYFLKLLGIMNGQLPLWLTNDLTTTKHLITEASSTETLNHLATQYSSLSIPRIMGFDIAFNLPAILVCLLLTFILLKGIKEAASTNLVMVLIKVSVVVFVIATGAFFINIENWTPFIPMPSLNSQGDVSYGYIGILSGAAYVFFAYIGFDAISTQAGEAKNPRKDIPFALIVSLVFCTTLYIMVSLVLTGMVNYKEIDVAAPIAAAFSNYGMKSAVWFISIAAVAGLTSVLLVNIMAQTRLFLAMSNDGLLPKALFGKLHPKYNTPFRGTLITGIVIALVAGITPIETLAKLVNIGTLFAFVMVCIAVLSMRRSQPNIQRPFKVPFLGIIAPLGIIFNVGMILSLEMENWVRLGIWLAVGLVVYFLYSHKNSLLGKQKIQ